MKQIKTAAVNKNYNNNNKKRFATVDRQSYNFAR